MSESTPKISLLLTCLGQQLEIERLAEQLEHVEEEVVGSVDTFTCCQELRVDYRAQIQYEMVNYVERETDEAPDDPVWHA